MPSAMLMTVAPPSTAKMAPLATPSLEHTKVSSMRTFMSGQFGHTPAIPRPLSVSGAAMPARPVPWPK
jgi:hypothetical protein